MASADSGESIASTSSTTPPLASTNTCTTSSADLVLITPSTSSIEHHHSTEHHTIPEATSIKAVLPLSSDPGPSTSKCLESLAVESFVKNSSGKPIPIVPSQPLATSDIIIFHSPKSRRSRSAPAIFNSFSPVHRQSQSSSSVLPVTISPRTTITSAVVSEVKSFSPDYSQLPTKLSVSSGTFKSTTSSPTMAASAVRAASSVATATATANIKAQAVNAVSELPLAHASYDELSLIGNGAYGTVYLGRDKTNEDRLVALKKIRITLTDDGVPVNALREIALLKQLEKFEHPNIVRLLDICHGRIERDSKLNLILVFEYVEQDLDHFLKNTPGPSLEPHTIKNLMHQVLCGVDFLHTNRIIHRDLKPQNLLVDRNHRVKIADFGLARIYDFHMRLTTMVVTLWYRAPEVLLSNSYATPVDLWSCGCIFAELFRKRPIFEGQTEGDQLQRIFDVIGKPLDSEWPKDVSLSLDNFRDHVGRRFDDLVPEITPDGADLLRKLLKFLPGSRLSAWEALKHPYFRGMTTPKITTAPTRSTSALPTLSTASHSTRLVSSPQKRPRRNSSPSAYDRAPKKSPAEMLASISCRSSISSFTSCGTTSQDSSSSLSTTINTSISNVSSFSDNSNIVSSSNRTSEDTDDDIDRRSGGNDENNPNAGNSSSSLTTNIGNANNNNNTPHAVVTSGDAKLCNVLDPCARTGNHSFPQPRPDCQK